MAPENFGYGPHLSSPEDVVGFLEVLEASWGGKAFLIPFIP